MERKIQHGYKAHTVPRSHVWNPFEFVNRQPTRTFTKTTEEWREKAGLNVLSGSLKTFTKKQKRILQNTRKHKNVRQKHHGRRNGNETNRNWKEHQTSVSLTKRAETPFSMSSFHHSHFVTDIKCFMFLFNFPNFAEYALLFPYFSLAEKIFPLTSLQAVPF